MSISMFDRLGEKFTRGLASYSSRRSVLGVVGTAIAAPAFPVLPVARAADAPSAGASSSGSASAGAPSIDTMSDFERNAQTKDATKCNYWRHCAIDGLLCGCCGGGVHTCPPGTEPSPVSWIGTCRNPDDGRSYVIAYRDCCGRTRCDPLPECPHCNTMERELPIYRPQVNNDIIWCFGTASTTYHCSTAAIIGQAS